MRSNAVYYDYLLLALLPVVVAIVPDSGRTEGSTMVTVTGSGFQSRGVVTFEAAYGSILGECRWGPDAGLNTSYTTSEVRLVPCELCNSSVLAPRVVA